MRLFGRYVYVDRYFMRRMIKYIVIVVVVLTMIYIALVLLSAKPEPRFKPSLLPGFLE